MTRRETLKSAIVQDNFLAGLQAWVELAAPEEREARLEAMQRILSAKQTNSRGLELDGLGLSSIPAEIGNLTALTRLNLSYNQLTTLPAEIGNLTALRELYFLSDKFSAPSRYNQLTTLPTEIGNLTALRSLDLYDNRLITLPAEIGNLTALTRLNLSGNQLITLPAEIGNLPALTHLNLGGNRLITLPAEIGNLADLSQLNLDCNQLTDLPAEIGNLTALRELRLERSQLTDLPEWIGNLTALRNLNLGQNQLTTLPEWIGNLTALTYLGLSRNQLNTLPAEIENLTALTLLYLNNNQLTTLPDSLLTPPAGLHRNIDLESNPISPAEATRLNALALAGGVTLRISIQDHQAPAAAQQQELANSIGDKILLNAPKEKREELKALLDSEQLPNFKLFLAECPRTEGWKSHEPEMTQCLLEILGKMSESEAVKIKCETLAATAFDSCGDRVGLAFVHMQLALNLSDKEVKDMSPQEVYDYAKQESVIKFLSDKSQARINQIKISGGGLDEIETHLAYLQIGQELGLNLRANGMLYQGCSNVTGRDLESAQEEFLTLDPDLRTAKHLYEDKMLRMHPFVQEIITEVSNRDEFSADQKEDENSQEYQARVNTLSKLFADAAITEIASRFNEFRSSAKTGSASAEGSPSQQTPNPTPNPTDGASVGGGLLGREER